MTERKRKQKNSPCLSTPLRDKVQGFMKEIGLLKLLFQVINLESSKLVKESSLKGKFQQNIASDNECNNRSPQPKVNLSINYVLVDSNKDYEEPKASKEFEKNHVM